jgi:hypothetical protein
MKTRGTRARKATNEEVFFYKAIKYGGAKVGLISLTDRVSFSSTVRPLETAWEKARTLLECR